MADQARRVDLLESTFGCISFPKVTIKKIIVMKNSKWKMVIQILISLLTALGTTLGTTSCMGHGPFYF